MTPKVFAKLLGLFVLLLVVQTVVMEFVFRRLVFASMANQTAGPAFILVAYEALWSGLVALLVAIPLAAWAAGRVSARLDRVMSFARRIAEGDLSARIAEAGDDEFAAMEAALNRTAESLGQSFGGAKPDRREPGSELR